MLICVYICVYKYTYTYVYIYTHAYIYIYLSVDIEIYTYMFTTVYLYVHFYTYMYNIYIDDRYDVCVIYMHTHIYASTYVLVHMSKKTCTYTNVASTHLYISIHHTFEYTYYQMQGLNIGVAKWRASWLFGHLRIIFATRIELLDFAREIVGIETAPVAQAI